MSTINIPCPMCSEPFELETDAPQQCDVHHWHARPGDTGVCEHCRYEWVAMTLSAGWWLPHNRETNYNDGTIDRTNDVFLAVKLRNE